jgi:hypothetical protein
VVGDVVNMTLLEVGGDVVLSGAGTMNLTSLTNLQPFFRGSSIVPQASQFGCGLEGPGPFNSRLYTGATFNSPTNFGTGGQTLGSSGTGDFFGVAFAASSNQLFVPSGYTSGSFISGTTTFNSTTLATLGATPGTYTWSWGSGPTASSIVMVVGTGSVTPTPTSTETLTPTPTSTETPTPTPSVTNTQTPTTTPTPSVTNTQTPTNTETPTTTPSETPTSTPTETPTSTPTNTPTQTSAPACDVVVTVIAPTPTPTSTLPVTPTPTPTPVWSFAIINSNATRSVTSVTINSTLQTLTLGSYPVVNSSNGYSSSILSCSGSGADAMQINFGGTGFCGPNSKILKNGTDTGLPLANYAAATFNCGGLAISTSDKITIIID